MCLGPLLCGVVIGVLSSLTIILLKKRERYIFVLIKKAVCVLCLFLVVPWVGLKSVVVTFPGHTNLFFNLIPRINEKH